MPDLKALLNLAQAAATQRTTASFYDRIADLYDTTFQRHRVHAESMGDFLDTRGRARHRPILDLGCGTGLLSSLLAGQIGRAHV